jgi:hypothetical protein
MAEGVEVVGVVRGQRDGEPEHRCGDRGHIGPQLAAPHPVPSQCRGGQSGGGDEPRDRDVQVRDVVVQREAELSNFGAGHVDLSRSNAELEKGTGEVADEEDDGVANECQAGERHKRRASTQGAGHGDLLGSTSDGCHEISLQCVGE